MVMYEDDGEGYLTLRYEVVPSAAEVIRDVLNAPIESGETFQNKKRGLKAILDKYILIDAELGKKALRPENIVKLSRALGVSTDYLLTGCRNARDYTIIDGKLKDVSPQEYDRIMRMIDIMLEK